MKTKHYPNWEFADRLAEELKKNKMTHTKIAKLIGVDRKTVGGWCGGFSSPDIVKFGQICKILKVSSDYMLYGEKKAG